MREGECVQRGHVLESTSSVNGWVDCANWCSLKAQHNTTPCEMWTYRYEQRQCKLYDSAERECTTLYTPSGIDPVECGAKGIPGGQLVIGGYDEENNHIVGGEVFPPVHTCSNSIPDLQRPKAEHSMSVLPGGVVVVCGGLTPDTKQSTRPLDTCEKLLTANDTEWTLFANMSQPRFGHVAWTPSTDPDKIVLLGGSLKTTEVITENESANQGSNKAFEVKHDAWQTCLIPLGDTSVLIGGGRKGNCHNHVTRYNIHGFVEELALMPESRYSHTCAAMPSTEGGLALVVIGGKEHDGNALSSVLFLVPKATAWTSLTSLPHPLTSATASIVGDRLRVIGGMFNGESQDEVCSFCQRESIKNGNTGS